MGTLYEDVFTCMIPRGILRRMRNVTVRTFFHNQNTYFRFKHFSEITYFTRYCAT